MAYLDKLEGDYTEKTYTEYKYQGMVIERSNEVEAGNDTRIYSEDDDYIQLIDTVQSYTTVIAYDTSASISIRKSGNDLVVTNFLHLWSVSIKYTLVMGSAVFGEDLMKLRAWLIAIILASFLCHTDTTIRHECSL